MSDPLLVNEIFLSIQGESSFAGWPCTFVRLSGCEGGCSWCDTGHAAGDEGTLMTPEAILDRVTSFGVPLVEITGGEPLQQENVHALLRELCDRNYNVLLETGGFLPVDRVDPRVCKIIDLKPPSSGAGCCIGNVELALRAPQALKSTFEFKIVIATRADYDWALGILRRYDLPAHCTVLMGAVHGRLEPSELAGWILQDRLRVRLQLQLHKYLWPGRDRGV